MDITSVIMLGLIGLLIVFMVRNGRKRREMLSKLQDGIRPGAKVMLQAGIFGTIEEVDEEDDNRILVRSGDSTLLVHRNAIGNIVDPVEVEDEVDEMLAPDDDPNFGNSTDSDDKKD